MRISDWSSDVCSSDLGGDLLDVVLGGAVDDQVLVEVAAPCVEPTDGRDVPAYLTDRRGQAAEGSGAVVQANPEADGEGGGRRCHGDPFLAREPAWLAVRPATVPRPAMPSKTRHGAPEGRAVGVDRPGGEGNRRLARPTS